MSALDFPRLRQELEVHVLARTGNRLQNDAAMIFINTHDSKITNNVSIGSNGSGIFFGGNVRNVEVSQNVLRNGAFTEAEFPSLPMAVSPTRSASVCFA